MSNWIKAGKWYLDTDRLSVVHIQEGSVVIVWQGGGADTFTDLDARTDIAAAMDKIVEKTE